MQEFFAQHLVAALILIALAIALTVFIFRKRLFDRQGVYREGIPANPEKIRRENRARTR